MMDNGEILVGSYLAKRGFTIERFDKHIMRQGRTPDFRVFVGDQFAFYCEVKTAQADDWLEKQLDAAPPGTLVGGLRRDPTYNRISGYVHDAASQFDSVNPDCTHPNVLAIANYHLVSGVRDLISVLTGNAYTKDSGRVRMFGNFSDGRIREEKGRIHLYLWFNAGTTEPSMLFAQSIADHHVTLCRYFGIDPANIKQL